MFLKCAVWSVYSEYIAPYKGDIYTFEYFISDVVQQVSMNIYVWSME
jgi:hypothetical protein